MEKGDKDVLLKLKEDYNNNLISALIGAGFSKNISSSFPNWSELLHDMIDDLYSVDIKRYYNNYLHLNKDTNCTLKSEKVPIALKRYHRSVVSGTIIALRAVPPVSL